MIDRLGDGAPRAKLGREADGAGMGRGVAASAQDGRAREKRMAGI